MENEEIIALYFKRDETALKQTLVDFGAYMKAVSYGILGNNEDSEECVNSALQSLWNTIPPNKPENFKAYIAKVTRNVSFGRYDYNTAKKRSCAFVQPIDELDFCLSNKTTPQTAFEEKELSKAISAFLSELPRHKRMVFVRRYFYCDSIAKIADTFDMSEGKVKSMLFQTRSKLKKYLEKQDMI